MSTFREDVQRAVEYHGHLCSGQCIGVKMARYALEILHIDPSVDKKRLMVFVESDRCPADAIATVTGARIGRRTLKIMAYGKTGATFHDMKNNRSIRIYRHQRIHPPEEEDMIDFYDNLPYEDLFTVQEVYVHLQETDLPGPPVEITTCAVCHEGITDGKQVEKNGLTLCQFCGGNGYYHL